MTKRELKLEDGRTLKEWVADNREPASEQTDLRERLEAALKSIQAKVIIDEMCDGRVFKVFGAGSRAIILDAIMPILAAPPLLPLLPQPAAPPSISESQVWEAYVESECSCNGPTEICFFHEQIEGLTKQFEQTGFIGIAAKLQAARKISYLEGVEDARPHIEQELRDAAPDEARVREWAEKFTKQVCDYPSESREFVGVTYQKSDRGKVYEWFKRQLVDFAKSFPPSGTDENANRGRT